jgi:hypothetical protein
MPRSGPSDASCNTPVIITIADRNSRDRLANQGGER